MRTEFHHETNVTHKEIGGRIARRIMRISGAGNIDGYSYLRLFDNNKLTKLPLLPQCLECSYLLANYFGTVTMAVISVNSGLGEYI